MVVLSFRLRALAGAVLTGIALLAGDTGAQRPQPLEPAIKAAFLYNFTRFVEWPASAFTEASGSFDVCVLAGEAFRREVEGVFEGEQVSGRAVRVVPANPSRDLKACHLVYIAAEDRSAASKRLAELGQTPILTVGEGRQFLEQGGLIAFQVESDRVRFDVNRRRAEAAGLVISSKLLRVARELWPS